MNLHSNVWIYKTFLYFSIITVNNAEYTEFNLQNYVSYNKHTIQDLIECKKQSTSCKFKKKSTRFIKRKKVVGCCSKTDAKSNIIFRNAD